MSADRLFSLCLAEADRIAPGGVWGAWTLAPETTVPLAAAALIQAMLLRRDASPPSLARTASFVAGYALLALALVSPLCRLAATLVSAHMLQHVVLVVLAPPLLILAWAPARRLRAHVPLWLASALYGAAIWVWHVPGPYQAALTIPTVHLAMYGTLLASAVLFWHAILIAARGPAHRTASAMLSLLATLVHTGMLGALLSFSRVSWYPLMDPGSAAWGISPLEDQQLAGLIMWVPMGGAYLAAGIALAHAGLAQIGRAGPAARRTA